MKHKIHRCPWCGEQTKKLGLKTETIKKCSNCQNRYTYHYDGVLHKIYSALNILSVISIFFMIINEWLAMCLLIFFMVTSGFFYDLTSYERCDDDKRVYVKKYKASIKFNKQSEKFQYLKQRYFLRDKEIIPICFVNYENMPISNMICICMENTKRFSDLEYECIISFLPLSAVGYDVSKGNLEFNLFKNRQLIGKGILISAYDKF